MTGHQSRLCPVSLAISQLGCFLLSSYFSVIFFFLVTFLSQPVVWLPTTFQTTSVIFDLGTCEYLFFFSCRF